MRTRSGNLYSMEDNLTGWKRKDRDLTGAGKLTTGRKSGKMSSAGFDNFDRLPDELVLCKRFRGLGNDSSVLSKASTETFAVTAKKWSESAYRFLKRCSDYNN
ncbi:hypothetical protein L2E82_51986 [Cichorium intybus]|nr:hypothetical protein L2E82_51986 [Cichorium intybus]